MALCTLGVCLASVLAWFRSEGYSYSGPRPAYSPDGRYIASAEEYRLVVRDVDTLQIVQLYSCLDRVKHIQWCCRSEYILCGLLKRPTVQVYGAMAPYSACFCHIQPHRVI